MHHSLLYLQWNAGINQPFVTEHLGPDVCVYTDCREGVVCVCACAYVSSYSCECVWERRLSLKLKQKSVRPPSQLYLFMPSAPQHPQACKHTTHPLCVAQRLNSQVGASAQMDSQWKQNRHRYTLPSLSITSHSIDDKEQSDYTVVLWWKYVKSAF